jgi:hypothetical protein
VYLVFFIPMTFKLFGFERTSFSSSQWLLNYLALSVPHFFIPMTLKLFGFERTSFSWSQWRLKENEVRSKPNNLKVIGMKKTRYAQSQIIKESLGWRKRGSLKVKWFKGPWDEKNEVRSKPNNLKIIGMKKTRYGQNQII